jgi:hypothetical protein
MDKLRETAKTQFRAGVFRQGREPQTSNQNQATNRNANLTIVNNYIDRSAEVYRNHMNLKK